MNGNSPIGTLQNGRHELVRKLAAGDDAHFLHSMAQLLDDYFRASFVQSRIGPRMRVDKNPYAVIALGGYGRREQCLHSDVDVLLLFRKEVPEEAAALVQEIVYPLWDAGFEVGYATRNFKECLKLATRDYEVLTSLLDARFVCGQSLLYSELREALVERIIKRHGKSFLKWMEATNELRHEQFGDNAYLLEPNLKEGRGGLRDYHVMLWMARCADGAREPRDLEYLGYLTNPEYTELVTSLEFIWRVRNHLHHLTGRKCDHLSLDYQGKLATAMGFAEGENLHGIEIFLGELQRHLECVGLRHAWFMRTAAPGRAARARRQVRDTSIPGIEIARQSLRFTEPEAILADRKLLVRIFEESARRKLPLSVEAQRLVREFSYLINDAFRSDPDVIRSFEAVLTMTASEFNVLSEMLNTGFLTRFIPEFATISHRIQYTEYHLHPVDKHSLRTVQIMKSFAGAENDPRLELCARLYKEISPKKLLYWACLLHDIGKGEQGPDHSAQGAVIVRRILERMGYARQHVDTVEFLVRNHLLLVKTAQRRDLYDEQTAISCARRIQDPTRLKMLHLLTVADSLATGPKAWNDWTASLLRELFLKVHQVLTAGELASRKAVSVLAKKEEVLAAQAEKADLGPAVRELLPMMSPRYLNDVPARDILRHARLHRRLGDGEAVLDAQPVPNAEARIVTVCGKDRPGLFSKIAGVLTLHNLNIFNAQIYTWRNHVALDSFWVDPPLDTLFEGETWEKVERDLNRAVRGELDLEKALAKKLADARADTSPTSVRRERIEIDNESSSFFTIIEIFAYDYIGLLYKITDALYRCRLDVWVSKIATKVDQVVDVFYVRDFDGQKADDPRQVAEIQAILEERIFGRAQQQPRNGEEEGHPNLPA